MLFTVARKHLSPDGKRASSDLPSAETHYVSEKEVLVLLKNVALIAATVEYPTEPEITLTGPTGKFIVRVKGGQLNLVSWSTAHKGGPASAEQIMAAISGEQTEDVPRPSSRAAGKTAASRPASSGKQSAGSDKLTIAALGIAIVAVNAFTIWFITQPPRSLTGQYQLLSTEQSKRVLQDVAGVYETGKNPGDRRLEVGGDASLRRIKYGSGGTPKDRQDYTVQAAEAAGKKALVTNRKSLVMVKDNISLVMYGDTYTRVSN
jgi:hypothetical protein